MPPSFFSAARRSASASAPPPEGCAAGWRDDDEEEGALLRGRFDGALAATRSCLAPDISNFSTNGDRTGALKRALFSKLDKAVSI
ncbi:hypothetical protein SR870_02810 [Rhodopseudomonas palustris]|uniref:hypothetical protein n=1 Tax=Rhodopseudomonas palustris TaxID=1076 RepID=UPI002ACE8637|nr:hypothetical protein [Rhodopseudomonas palustris]WQH00244.1 hypothetical protein SR870_02810 [Rhodopseudomonas palustris]